MITARESIEKFDQKTSELINCKFLLAEKKIEEVLVTIADSVLLYELFEHVTQNFDYAPFKGVCFSTSQGKGCFRLPKNEADVIAFCFSLLLEIDAGKVDLLKLCDEYFSSEDGRQKSFNLFAIQLLVPFKNATLNVAYAVLDAKGEEKPNAVKNPIEENTNGQNRQEKQKSLAEKYVGDLRATAQRKANASKTGEDYDELIFVLEELEDYLSANNLRGVTLAFTALKYLSEKFSVIEIDLKRLANLIAEVV